MSQNNSTPVNIGVLLPRSIEYPSMAFDLLDGLRFGLKNSGLTNFQLHTENIGFGEDADLTHARAEKLVLEKEVELIIAYATSLNAEALYSFAGTAGKPFLFLDAGMELFEAPTHPLCRHLTLQGMMACMLSGRRAGEGGKKIISASSFYDGGYRSSWAFQGGVTAAGGTVVSNFVTQFQEQDFTLAPLLEQIQKYEAQGITASFSSYFETFFMRELKKEEAWDGIIPVYCSPFMGDEQLLRSIPFPGGTFEVIVPWGTALDNIENKIFTATIQKEKNKTATIFHLLGWEAASVAEQIITKGIDATNGWTFESPRGSVCFHPETNNAYAPLYEGRIEKAETDECRLTIIKEAEVTAEEHRRLYFLKPEGSYSRWKNNYFSI